VEEMRKRFTTALALALAFAVPMGLTACGGEDSTSTSTPAATTGGKIRRGDVLTIAVAAPPIGLNPQNPQVVFPFELAIEPLIVIQPNEGLRYEYGPGLATSWRYVGEGNRVFELTLREDARFSDGSPVNARAVKTWFDYLVTSRAPQVPGLIGQVASVEAVDEFTVRINLRVPNPSMEFALSSATPFTTLGYVEAPSCVARPERLRTDTCGAGPYMLDKAETVAGDSYTFVPNPHYYDKSRQHFNKVVVKAILQPSSMLQALQTGQVDIAESNATAAPAAEQAGFNVVTFPERNMFYPLDVRGARSEPLAKLEVRQALNYAIDRDAIARTVYNGYATPSSEFESSDGMDPAYQDYYEYDPEKARELLARAGYPNGFELEGQVDDETTVPVVAQTQAVAKYWEAIGVRLKFKPIPVASYYNAFFTNPGPFIFSQSTTAYSMWAIYGLYFAPGTSYFNRIDGGWRDAELTRLYEEGSRAEDPTPYWRDMTARLTEQAFVLHVVNADHVWLTARNIRGWDGPAPNAADVYAE
jgi:peptide/nickel transport system substrate-binding protein